MPTGAGVDDGDRTLAAAADGDAYSLPENCGQSRVSRSVVIAVPMSVPSRR